MMRPRRPGRRPTTSTVGPHRQLDQRSPEDISGELARRVIALDGVEEGVSQVSVASSRAIFLTDVLRESDPRTSLAPGQRLEPVHLHGIEDTSLHAVLPPEVGAEMVRLGWGEAHQYEDFGTEFMIYGPRNAVELEIVMSLIQESLAFALAAQPDPPQPRPGPTS